MSYVNDISSILIIRQLALPKARAVLAFAFVQPHRTRKYTKATRDVSSSKIFESGAGTQRTPDDEHTPGNGFPH